MTVVVAFLCTKALYEILNRLDKHVTCCIVHCTSIPSSFAPKGGTAMLTLAPMFSRITTSSSADGCLHMSWVSAFRHS